MVTGPGAVPDRLGIRSRARAGVGWSENPNSRRAGEEAARAALEKADTSEPDLVLLWQTSKHDPVHFHAGVRAVVGPRPRMVGGYSVGIITNDFLGYEGHQAGVAVLEVPGTQVDVIAVDGLHGREREVGRELGRRIVDHECRSEPSLLLMYDAIRETSGEGLLLNMATPLIQGMAEGMGIGMHEWGPAAGVGMMGDMQGNATFQFVDDAVRQQTAIALCLSGDVRMHTVIMHGCKPAGRYYAITATDGPVVLELEGRPALEVVDEMLGGETSWEQYPLFLTLGVNKGGRFDEFKEENWANRLCMSVDRKRKGLMMFEPDLKPGMEVQLMRRSIDFEYIGRRARDLLDSLGDRHPFFALYIDCAGRAAAYCGIEEEEATEVQKAVGEIPLLGFHSGVEIAKVGGEMQALDWTGVLCVFTASHEA
jgi:small ligand-binding sensory domain FIST